MERWSALIMLGCFCILSCYSMGVTHQKNRIAIPVILYRDAMHVFKTTQDAKNFIGVWDADIDAN